MEFSLGTKRWMQREWKEEEEVNKAEDIPHNIWLTPDQFIFLGYEQ